MLNGITSIFIFYPFLSVITSASRLPVLVATHLDVPIVSDGTYLNELV